MSKFITLVVFSVAVALNSVFANDELKQALLKAYQPVISECSQEHGITQDQIETVKKTENPDGVNSCFIGCLLKKTDVINAEGKYDAAAALSKLKEFVKDEQAFAKVESVSNKCTSVNDEAVSDGAAGCDRGKLLVTCLLQNKGELPL